MKWISFWVARIWLVLSFFIVSNAWAESPPGFHQSHPLAMMHGLPTGELPGWSAPWWVNFEIGNGNVWNAPLLMTDNRNGKLYSYTADFEQINAFLEIGHAFTERIGASLEIPYVYRSGGMLDNLIDSYHVLIGNRRYSRNAYPSYQDVFSVKVDGSEFYKKNDLSDGIANLRLKLKFWFLKWAGRQKSACPCGLALSSQTKFATQDAQQGGTTGNIDQSVLLHLGIPLGDASAMWFTGGETFLGSNPAMKNWPRFHHITMYELNFDIELEQGWGLLLSARAESPFLDEKHLTYFDTATDPTVRSNNRAASGWNGLVHWRGSESAGVRYRTRFGNQIQFLIVEDWGIGKYDATDNFYSNDAPDVNFVLQSKISW